MSQVITVKSEYMLLSAAVSQFDIQKIKKVTKEKGLTMAANSDNVARDFCLSTLQNNVRGFSGLQDQCRYKDADPDNLEFAYKALRKR